jgi:hypothetical protein
MVKLIDERRDRLKLMHLPVLLLNDYVPWFEVQCGKHLFEVLRKHAIAGQIVMDRVAVYAKRLGKRPDRPIPLLLQGLLERFLIDDMHNIIMQYIINIVNFYLKQRPRSAPMRGKVLDILYTEALIVAGSSIST